jgi:hypothetical protein
MKRRLPIAYYQHEKGSVINYCITAKAGSLMANVEVASTWF